MFLMVCSSSGLELHVNNSPSCRHLINTCLGSGLYYSTKVQGEPKINCSIQSKICPKQDWIITFV